MRRFTKTRLHQILAAQGIEYSELAQRTGLKSGTLYNVASGTNTSARARNKIEAALGVRINWADKPTAPTTSSNET